MMGGQSIKEAKNAAKSVNIIFSLNEAVGALAESLKIFKVTGRTVFIFNPVTCLLETPGESSSY
jgi:hypothetical protein